MIECILTIRSFLLSNYPKMKQSNPEIPIMIRESSGTLPTVIVRYEFGKEVKTDLDGMPSEEIAKTFKQLVS